jgi:hypothetical protein
MDATQIALWALGISFFSLIISACSFVLEFRRWFDEGVKLTLSVIPEAKMFGGPIPDENTYVSVTVTNRGDAPTTLTHLVVYAYPNTLAVYTPRRLLRWFKQLKPKMWLIANTGGPNPIPYTLEPGRYWVGMALHTPEVKAAMTAGQLYVGMVSSHSDKTLFKRVRLWKPPSDAEAVSS